MLIFELHNYVNTKTNKPIAPIKILETYKNISFRKVTANWFNHFRVNIHDVKLIWEKKERNKVRNQTLSILNDNIGPISKSTFEVHTEVLLDASRHASLDYMRGVSASVMMGQTGNYGTGMFQVVLDMEAMKDLDDVDIETRKKDEEINKLFGKIENQEDSCARSNITISNSLSNMKQQDVGTVDDDYDLGI